MASHANPPWAHLMQDTAGMANLTPPIPLPSGMRVTLPNSRIVRPQIHQKWRKRRDSCKPTPSSSSSNIAISEGVAAPLPFTDNAKQSLTIRLLPPHQFLRKSLKNLQIYIQSSTSLPSHLPKHTSIKHRHFKCNCCAAKQ